MKKKKRLGGFRNIHIAHMGDDGVYEAPVHITGGKSINIELSYESEEFESDDVIDHQEFIFTGGEGTLGLKSLAIDEFNLIFNNKKVKGGVVVSRDDLSPNCAVLFERQKKDKINRRFYVVYNTKFAPSSIKAETAAKIGNEEIDELKFSVGTTNEGYVYHIIDTDDPTVTQEQITKWYTEVQMPIEIEEAPATASEVNEEIPKKKISKQTL